MIFTPGCKLAADKTAGYRPRAFRSTLQYRVVHFLRNQFTDPFKLKLPRSLYQDGFIVESALAGKLIYKRLRTPQKKQSRDQTEHADAEIWGPIPISRFEVLLLSAK
jgi:hypothetical protein